MTDPSIEQLSHHFDHVDDQDPEELIRAWLTVSPPDRWKLATELELRLLALQVHQLQQLVETTDSLALNSRDLVNLFKASGSQTPSS